MQIETKSKSNPASKTKDLVTTAMLIAIIFVATYIHFPCPISINSGGLIHMGDIALFTIAIIFGKKKGAIAATLGMTSFDLLSGFTVWAPFTFVIRVVMGYMIGSIANSHNRNGNNLIWNIIAITLGSIWMVAGYFIANLVIFNSLIQAIYSIPGDLIQIAFGFVVGLPLTVALKKTKIFN